jgi:hypothetical protein
MSTMTVDAERVEVVGLDELAELTPTLDEELGTSLACCCHPCWNIAE